jgi:hypothetical protein
MSRSFVVRLAPSEQALQSPDETALHLENLRAFETSYSSASLLNLQQDVYSALVKYLRGWNCSLFLPTGGNLSVGFDAGAFVVDRNFGFIFHFSIREASEDRYVTIS